MDEQQGNIENETLQWDLTSHSALLAVLEYLEHNHDPELVKRVISRFYEPMRDDEFVAHELLVKFMKCVFSRMMEGQTADQAFGLKAVRGKYPRTDITDRDIAIAALVIHHMSSGNSWENSIYYASDRLGISDTTTKRAYRQYHSVVKLLLPETIRSLAEEVSVSP